MNKKKLFIGCSVALGVVILLIIVGVFFAYKYFISPIISSRTKMPEELKTPGVLTGSDFLSKEIFVQNLKLGTITDIAFGEFDPVPEQEIGIVGTKGVLFLDENRNVKSSVMFSVRAGHVDIVDVDGDNTCEYLDRGGGWHDVSLIDHNGNSIWTYGGMPGVNDITAGDIDGDGSIEFVVGFNGGGGLRLLDRNGKEKWKQSDGNVWHVELVDTNSNGNLEIVHSNAGGKITVRDTKGKIIRRSKPAPYFSDFSLTTWPTKNSKIYALLAEDDTIWVFDFDGKTIAQYNAPLSGSLGHARGVPIKFSSVKPEFFAVVVEYSNWEKSLLYIYGQDNSLVYQEILPEACASIASISIDSTDKETLIVGCNGKVWKYFPIN